MERYLLRYFLAVVDNGNFSRAAQQVNVTQPTLSVGIAKLEEALGVTLFERTNRRVHLTKAGAQLLPRARRIESEFNQAAREVVGHSTVPVVRLGVLTTISSQLIADAVRRSLDENPDSRTELVEGNERELANLLSRGRIDAALTLVHRGGNRFFEERLFEEGYAAAMPLDHPLANETIISAEALAGNVMIVRRHCEALSETSRHFIERGVRPYFSLKSANDDRVLAMVAAGLGITIVPKSHKREGLVLKDLSGFELRRSIGLAYAPHTERAWNTNATIISALRELDEARNV